MSFDGIVTRAMVHELNQKIIGGRISKIYQPHTHDLNLVIRAKGENHILLISAHPSFPRIQLTSNKENNPKTPPSFCMFMRKHCEGGTIQSITQVGMERIIYIDILSRSELGDPTIRRLVVEIMGRHSNIILIKPEDEQILDSMIHVNSSTSRYRQVLPGQPYVLPPSQQKIHPLEVDKTKFIAGFDYNGGQLDRQIVSRFTGIGPQLAKEIVHRAGIGQKEQLWVSFSSIMQQVAKHIYEPTLIEGKKKTFFSAFPLTYLQGNRQTFPSMNQCVDKFYTKKVKQDQLKQKIHQLAKRVQSELSKNQKKIQILEKESVKIQQADQWRIYGELLMAHLHEVQRGETEVEVNNFFEPESPMIKIPLDPAFTPAKNAERFFKKYHKLKSAKKWNFEQKEKTYQHIQYLESILVQLQYSDTQEIEQIRDELIETGILRKSQRKKKKQKAHPTPLQIYSSDQTPIWIGKNNRQNDYLTHKLARSQDTWLHTKEIPGSHVVIRSEQFSKQTLYEAAMLAAYFSKAKESSQVPVDYTLVKHVKKPNGAHPGYVIYKNQRTLYVTPDQKIIQQLLRNS